MTQTNQVVIVTGASGNLGRAVVALLDAAGASVVAVDRAADALGTTLSATTAPDRHHAMAGIDLTDAASAERAVAAAVARYGRIDGVVHTVGGFAFGPLADSDAALWDRMFRLNTLTTLNLFRPAIAAMRPNHRGSLVAIGAGAGQKAPAGVSAYAASKSAVLRLVESFAAETKADGLRVNAVLPGIIDTPPNRAAMPGADTSTWVTAEQVAAVIGFLVSDAASGVTGALVPVTGRG